LRGFAPNDRMTPAPHQTGQAVFPHPAFRVPFPDCHHAHVFPALAFRYSVICSSRTFAGVGSPCRPSPRPLPLFATAEQVVSLRSPWVILSQRSSLLPRPPTPAPARLAFSVSEVVPVVELFSPEQVSPLTLSSLPLMSPTQTPPVHWEIPRWLFRVSLCGLRLQLRGSAAGVSFSRLILVVHSHCDLTVRLHAGSPPRLTATQ
jgi:hypothetical protein